MLGAGVHDFLDARARVRTPSNHGLSGLRTGRSLQRSKSRLDIVRDCALWPPEVGSFPAPQGRLCPCRARRRHDAGARRGTRRSRRRTALGHGDLCAPGVGRDDGRRVGRGRRRGHRRRPRAPRPRAERVAQRGRGAQRHRRRRRRPRSTTSSGGASARATATSRTRAGTARTSRACSRRAAATGSGRPASAGRAASSPSTSTARAGAGRCTTWRAGWRTRPSARGS